MLIPGPAPSMLRANLSREAEQHSSVSLSFNGLETALPALILTFFCLGPGLFLLFVISSMGSRALPIVFVCLLKMEMIYTVWQEISH